MACPLCLGVDSALFYANDKREYWRCPECDLVFVPPQFHLSAEAEKARYQLHENSPDDPHYCQFLARIIPPLLPHLSAGDTGLDFGSGPGPTLSLLLEKEGFPMAIYDPFFAPDTRILQQKYNFITSTEVLEHAFHPAVELDRLFALLHPNGTLAIMTRRHDSTDNFSHWGYKDDPSHVCFFSKNSFRWIANRWQTTRTFIDNDIILLQI